MDFVHVRLALFLLLSAAWIVLSWKSIFNPRSHGFYRFFSWEAITALILWNLPHWFSDPFSFTQILSWALLIGSLLALAGGVGRLHKAKRSPDRRERELYHFERTTELVTSGIYRYIRHPMYASLLFLAWGSFLKEVSWVSFVLVVASCASLFGTALADEKECVQYFGRPYTEYMKETKRFIPFVF